MHIFLHKRILLMMNGFLIKIFFCICLSYISTIQVYAQLDNKLLENDSIFIGSNIKKVQFKFNSLNYIRNNEYFNEIADGYTLFGYYINPFLVYKPIEKVQIEGGFFARKEFGTSGLKQLEPTLKITVNERYWRYIFGNIEGNIQHKLIEPLMSFERLVSNPLENGIQAKYEHHESFFDIWIDWQKSTIAGKNNQESIWGGASYISPAVKLKNTDIQGIGQFSVSHLGGQNLTLTLPVRTAINVALGIRLKKDLKHNQSIVFDNYYLKYFESPLQGSGYYLNTYWKNNRFQAGLSYWLGNHFNSPFGNDLMQSKSKKYTNDTYYEAQRNLVLVRFAKDWLISKNIGISLRFEPVFDFNNQIFDHSEGLYLKCNF